MRVAVISDIHGNFNALRAVLADIDRCQVAEIISLGDNVGYGPEPREVVRSLRERGVLSIMGNHEYALANPAYLARLNPAARDSLLLNGARLSGEEIAYLTGLPPLLLRHRARFVHGCPPKSMTAYLVEPSGKLLGKLFAAMPEPLCFHGHTHALALFVGDGAGGCRQEFGLGVVALATGRRYLVNPGSVGQPRDEINRHAKYLIWDVGGGALEERAVAYDVADTVAKLRQAGYPSFNAERLLDRG